MNRETSSKEREQENGNTGYKNEVNREQMNKNTV